MARCRQSMPGSILLILIVIGVCQLLQPVKSFSTNRQLARLLGNLDDIGDEDTEQLYDEEVSHVAKRENKGTCTCTCETRPAVVSEQSSSESATSGIVKHPIAKLHPESAALMRTATTTTKDTKSKQQSQPQQQQQQQQQSKIESKSPVNQLKIGSQKTAPSLVSYGHIVKVPPMNDYEAVEHPISEVISNEPEEIEEGDDEESAQSEQEQTRNDRFPWERLPDTMCFREHCSSDRDCCRRFNICDRSAHVCVDCWYGSSCTSERDCCLKYKYCQREWKANPATGKEEIVGGKCVSEL